MIINIIYTSMEQYNTCIHIDTLYFYYIYKHGIIYIYIIWVYLSIQLTLVGAHMQYVRVKAHKRTITHTHGTPLHKTLVNYIPTFKKPKNQNTRESNHNQKNTLLFNVSAQFVVCLLGQAFLLICFCRFVFAMQYNGKYFNDFHLLQMLSSEASQCSSTEQRFHKLRV